MAQKILVIEDEPAITDNVTYALATEGFEVAACATGEEGQEILAGGGVDLVILDVGLPDCNGFELCKAIRRASAVPIIFLTARASEVDRIVGLEIGGDDYVVKPFSPRELAARVKVILRRTAGPAASAAPEGTIPPWIVPVSSPSQSSSDNPQSAIRNPQSFPSSPFLIDRQRMRIHYLGKPLDLSRYEFKILETLIARPGWVFTRQQLMNHVCEEPGASLERTIDSHIKTLRARLKEITPDADPIQTHRGFGYSLRDEQ